MGQTVRNQGPYDRLWMPGVPRNDRSAQPPERSKIEYLDDHRRAKAGSRAEQPEGLAYDSNFRRAAAVHGDKSVKTRYLKESPVTARPRPQGVGGRQQHAAGTGRAQVPIRGQQGAQRAAHPVNRTSGETAPRGKRQRSGTAAKVPAAKNRAVQERSRQAPRQNDPRSGRQTPGQNDPRSGRQAPRQNDPRSGRQAPRQNDPRSGRQPARAAQTAKSSQKRPAAQAAKNSRPRGPARPQRDTVTDFHTVTPRSGAAVQTKKQVGTQSAPGHGRRIRPTYDAKSGKGGQRKQKNVPIMEGGVVGFDIGPYGREAAAGPAERPIRPGSVFTTILTIAICFVLFTAVLAGQARLSDFTQQNATLEKSIADMEENISKLKMQIALEEDLGNIQERAVALGLQNPDDSQIEYVDLAETDEVKTAPALVLSEQSYGAPAPGLFGALAAWFDTMLHGSERTAAISTASPASGG